MPYCFRCRGSVSASITPSVQQLPLVCGVWCVPGTGQWMVPCAASGYTRAHCRTLPHMVTIDWPLLTTLQCPVSSALCYLLVVASVPSPPLASVHPWLLRCKCWGLGQGGGLVSLLTSPAVGQFRLRAPVQPPANRQPSPHLAPTRAKCRVNWINYWFN